MAKKIYHWVRYRRPKTPAPKHGWVRSELARLTGLRESTIRYYINQHIIKPIELRGTASRYSRRELMCLLGLMRLKTEEEETTLVQKKKKLDAMSDEELGRWLCTGALPAGAATALGLPLAPGATPPASCSLSSAHAQPTISQALLAASGLERLHVECWQRITLLPGLDLMLRSDANDVARFAAERICAEFVAR